jgi:hypothetical protein
MSTQYRLVQSGKTASGGCSAGQGSSEPVAPRIYLFFIYLFYEKTFRNTVPALVLLKYFSRDGVPVRSITTIPCEYLKV